MTRSPRPLSERKWSWVPFGIGETKPHHFLEMVKIAWRNRRHPLYAWRVLSRGTCDGCALGTSGLKDWTIDGTHLCLVRLNLLELNTMRALDERVWSDVEALRRRSSKELRALGRLAHPMRRRKGEPGFTRGSWDEVWLEVGERWRSFAPERTAMFVTSRGVTNEVYYVAQKVMRFLGTNNVDNSARLCHSPSTSGLKTTLGVAATTCSCRDWYDADLIVFLGSNPANDQPVSMKYLLRARKNGTRVLSVNAYREPGMERYWVPSDVDSALFGTRIVDETFLVRIGGDLAFLNAVAKVVLERGWQHAEFIAAATDGFEEWRAELDRQPMDALLSACGLTLEQVTAFAEELHRSARTVFVWSMGITQHEHGADTVRALVNLGLLFESVGRPGTGMMPIRGHSGVQGGAEMGAYSTALPGGLEIDEANARHFSQLWGFPVPSRPGLTTVDQLEAARRGELDAFYCIGGNFLETMPEPKRMEEALARIPLRIHSDIVLSSQMLVDPAETVFVLPARTRYEQAGGGTETSTERRVIFSPEIPGHDVGEARSEWQSLFDLARAGGVRARPPGRGPRDPRRHRARRPRLSRHRGAPRAGRSVPVGRAAPVRGSPLPDVQRTRALPAGRSAARRRARGGRSRALHARDATRQAVQLDGAGRARLAQRRGSRPRPDQPRRRRAPRAAARRSHRAAQQGRRVPRPRLPGRLGPRDAPGTLARGQRPAAQRDRRRVRGRPRLQRRGHDHARVSGPWTRRRSGPCDVTAPIRRPRRR